MKKYISLKRKKNVIMAEITRSLSYSAFEILFALKYNLYRIQLFHLFVIENISACRCWQEASVICTLHLRL